jgi:integral membrane protein
VNADRQLAVVVRAYRALAYVTGTVLIILCFVGIPLQVWANNLVIVRYVGTAHGLLYIAYVIVAFVMTRMVRMKVASPGTVIVLLAGTIPVLTFVVERWVTRKYIDPALAASAARPTASAAVGTAGGSGGSSPQASTAGGSGGSSPQASTAGGSGRSSSPWASG